MSKSKKTTKTPATTEGSKRELSSPFDPNDPKKARALSLSSDMSDTEGSTGAIMNVSLQEEDIVKISDLLKSTFESQLSTIVSNIIDGVVHGLQQKMDALESENAFLKNKVNELENKLIQAQDRQDKADQYSRRNCFRLSGIREAEGESTDQIALDMTKAIGADLKLEEIDRSHRLGKPRGNSIAGSQPQKPRQIIVKFTSYRARNKVLKLKAQLKHNGYPSAFLNEDLTTSRSSIFFQARKLLKDGHIQGTWTSDGVIIVKGKDDRKRRIETQSDLDALKLNLGINT